MNYEEAVNYLFTSAPLFQQIGSGAYKEGLSTTHILDEHFNHPHKRFQSIHIAGTNGKGSCSHTIAAILQDAGYKVGLYTSPHLVDFRERIRVNGKPVSQKYVIDFIENERAFFEPLHPSFFELTTAMTFKYFAEQNIDIAVVEVGLGGRLDCTNIITPLISIITNISFDHTQFLGDTLGKIAGEKAGIIKPNIPGVIGETTAETYPVFENKATDNNAEIFWAEKEKEFASSQQTTDGGRLYQTKNFGELKGELGGLCQEKNTNTILCALKHLKGLSFSRDNVYKGFSHVCELTGLMGRWQTIQNDPKVVCDTGHNVGGWTYLSEQLKKVKCKDLHIIIGMVNDKDINGVMSMMPKNAIYYFTKANVKRARDEKEVMEIAKKFNLKGICFPSVKTAYKTALSKAGKDDFIFVGGSSFIVADLLTYLETGL